MPNKYRKLQPHRLLAFARAVTTAAQAVGAMATQLRVEGCKSIAAKGEATLEPHHFANEARELNCAVRALVALTDPVREELHLVSREMKRTKRQKRKDAPKCGAWKAYGGRCSTRLEPGEFRCPVHAAELRTRRQKRDGLKPTSQRGSSSKHRATGIGSRPEKHEKTTTSCPDVTDGKVTAVDVGPSGYAESET